MFYGIERRLSETGHVRRSGETFTHWIARIQEVGPPLAGEEQLKDLLFLHYRLRFDPKGITQTEMEELKNGVRTWLEQQEAQEKSV